MTSFLRCSRELRHQKIEFDAFLTGFAEQKLSEVLAKNGIVCVNGLADPDNGGRIFVTRAMNQTVSVLLFGITRELVGQSKLSFPLPPDASVSHLLATLKSAYPRLGELKSLLVAVNNEYADADTRITSADEIALIPPVSGG